MPPMLADMFLKYVGDTNVVVVVILYELLIKYRQITYLLD